MTTENKSNRSAFKQGMLLTFFALLVVGCRNKELQIAPIGNGIYQIGNVENPSCIEFQYYTIANYENIAPDSLYNILNSYIKQKTSYGNIVNNIENNCFCSFGAFFYKKSLFANYEKYISDAKYSEMGGIAEHRDNLLAKIYAFGNYDEHKHIVFSSIIYNKDSIIFLKRDTIKANYLQ